MLRIAQLALLVGSLVGVLAVSTSLSHADGPDAKNAPANASKNAAAKNTPAPKNAASNAPAAKNDPAPKNAAGNGSVRNAPLTVPDPHDNISMWLLEAQTQPAGEEFEAPPEPDRTERGPRRADSVPGVVELSTGAQMPGMLYTTRGKDLDLWVEEEKNWRRIPLIAVLSATAIVVEEEMELVWRWKAQGVNERVYTGESFPTRRLLWTFRLIDGTTLKGAIKGQPIWVDFKGTAMGPFLLPERQKGAYGETLNDLVYIKKIVVSKRMMDAVTEDVLKKNATGAPANQPTTQKSKTAGKS